MVSGGGGGGGGGNLRIFGGGAPPPADRTLYSFYCSWSYELPTSSYFANIIG